MNARTETLLLLIFCLPAAAHAEPYRELTETLAAIARRTGYKRLAVMPLQPVSGAASQTGEVLAARLVSQLVLRDEVEIVERALLDQVLEEQGLGYKGVIQPEQAKTAGQVLGVDAIVTGTYLKLGGGRIEVHARLIDAGSARILGAATAKVRKEWREDLLIASSDVWDTPPPPIAGFQTGAPELKTLPDFRDALSGVNSCDNWEERVETTQEATVEARARYWAARLRDPNFHASTLTRNPGSDIRDISLRQRFYRRTEELYAADFAEGLSVREQERLQAADREVKRVVDECYYK